MTDSHKVKIWLAAAALLAIAGAACGCGGGEGETGAPRITSHGTGENYAGFCLLCHGPGTGRDEFPPDHAGRADGTCLSCHR